MAEERRGDYYSISDKLSAHGELLGRIEERQIATNHRLDRMNGSVAQLWAEMSATKKRLSTLERWRSALVGAYTATMVAAGAWLKWNGK